MTRLIAIGLDAAERSLVEELLQSGEMPTLARLRAHALTCELSDTEDYRSEKPWTQFATGRRSDDLKYWTCLRFDPDTYATREVGASTAPPFWAGTGLRTIAFDVPHTRVADAVEGVQVVAWGAHSPQAPRSSSPVGLLDEIDREVGVHPAFLNDSDPGWYDERYMSNIDGALHLGMSRRPVIMERLVERLPDWELMLTVFSEPHIAGHQFWHGWDRSHPLHDTPHGGERPRDRLVAAYAAVDRSIGQILDRHADEDTAVLVFSVHGMEGNANDVLAGILLPELLHRMQFDSPVIANPHVEFDSSRHDLIIPARGERQADYLRRMMTDAPGTNPVRRLMSSAKRMLPVSASVWRRRLREARSGTLPWWEMRTDVPSEADPNNVPMPEADIHIPMRYQRWWPEMRTFVLPTYSDAHFRVNLAGRERHGIVAKEDYDSELDRIVGLLEEVTCARTGRPIVGDVVRTRTSNPFDPDGPDSDLSVTFRVVTDVIHHPAVGVVGPVPLLRTGAHNTAGFAYLSGPGIQAAHLGERRSIDLAATVLTHFGRGSHAAGTPLQTGQREAV